VEKRSLLQNNLLLSAFWKNIPGDRKEFPVWVERVAAPVALTSLFLVSPFVKSSPEAQEDIADCIKSLHRGCDPDRR